MTKLNVLIATLIITVSTLISSRCNACTAFFTKAKDGGIVYARSLEFAMNLQPSLAVFPRKIKLRGVTSAGENGLQWKSKFGFVGMNIYGKPYILDGMNEKGLLCGAFYFPGFFYLPEFKPQNASKSVANIQLGSWMLSNFANVKEVKQQLKDITIVPTVLKEMGMCPPLHFLVLDAVGDCIVIEPTRSGIKIYDNPVSVITNSPPFDWHLNNLRQYIKLSSKNIDAVKLGRLKLTPIGSGSGMFGVPGDITPPSRFVRAAFYLNHLPAQKDSKQALNTVMRLMKYFYITKGMVVEEDGKQSANEYTMWESYADIKKKCYYYATYDNINIRKVDLNRLNFQSEKIIQFDINQPQKFIDITDQIIK